MFSPQVFRMDMAVRMFTQQAANLERMYEREKQNMEKAMDRGEPSRVRIIADAAICYQEESIQYTDLAKKMERLKVRYQRLLCMASFAKNADSINQLLRRLEQCFSLQQMQDAVAQLARNVEDHEVSERAIRNTVDDEILMAAKEDRARKLIEEVAARKGINMQEEMIGVSPPPAPLPVVEHPRSSSPLIDRDDASEAMLAARIRQLNE